ncbi:MAG: hypothetical protein R3321_09340 [Nitrososphaeraceae archaeon]|nr:hypothetical protein [Nitrososphaeraceae archaeon]
MPDDAAQFEIDIPIKKYLPIIIGFIVFFIFILFLILITRRSGSNTEVQITPVPRPTATPFPLSPTVVVNSIPFMTVTPKPTSAISIGRLAYIKDEGIFHSDFENDVLLIANDDYQRDLLRWSSTGKYLAWKEYDRQASSSSLVIRENIPDKLTREQNGNNEVYDYDFSPNDKFLVAVHEENPNKISIYFSDDLLLSSISEYENHTEIKQIIWPDDELIIFRDNSGIGSIKVSSYSGQLRSPYEIERILDNKAVQFISLSKDHSLLAYSTGSQFRSELYVIGVSELTRKKLLDVPKNIDMGQTRLPFAVLNGGYTPYMFWLPDSQRLLVGFHYLRFIPLVGIYDLEDNSFKAISPFSLEKEDKMIDNFRLIGERLNRENNATQVNIFSLEEDNIFKISKVISGAYSPTYFYGENFYQGE